MYIKQCKACMLCYAQWTDSISKLDIYLYMVCILCIDLMSKWHQLAHAEQKMAATRRICSSSSTKTKAKAQCKTKAKTVYAAVATDNCHSSNADNTTAVACTASTGHVLVRLQTFLSVCAQPFRADLMDASMSQLSFLDCLAGTGFHLTDVGGTSCRQVNRYKTCLIPPVQVPTGSSML